MRPSIALCTIMRDEKHNLQRLLESVEGCFDEIHITDTGSIDGGPEWLKEHGSRIAKCPVHVHYFEWIHDFAAARNYAFSKAKTDYICWIDHDDILHNRESFIHWRDHAMQFADAWYANYHYAVDSQKNPLITFVRERVIKNDGSFKWQYFVHEGLVPQREGVVSQISHVWSVKHLRSDEDFKKDRSRNISMLEAKRESLPSRLLFYLGKEQYDNGKPEEALKTLLDASVKPDLEGHDRILALQYACYAAMQMAQMMKPEFQSHKYALAEKLAKQGLELDPTRAEFHCIVGDAFVSRGQLLEALPWFHAAAACVRKQDLIAGAVDPIFHFKDCYKIYPKTQIAKIFFQIQKLDESKALCEELKALGVPEAQGMLDEIQKAQKFVTISSDNRKQTEDIVFTCPPQGAYPFDEVLYQQKGMGGSETALIEMARLLKEKTGRRVIVFNPRDSDLIAPSGVEYIDVRKMPEYMSEFLPKVHIAWRHNIRVTAAPTYLWCHDLVTQGVESAQNFDKILCLSQFHKDYVRAMQGVPEEKIIVTRNGIDTKKFDFERPSKNPLKIVFPSSPDRGLDYAMLIVDKMRETSGHEFELHVYYGFDNLYKYGMAPLADKLKEMARARPWVHLHGFMEQKQMYREMANAAIWLYPANFIETFAITALEMLALRVYPVTRVFGALQNTLAEAKRNGQALLIANSDFGDASLNLYAECALNVFNQSSWKNMDIDMSKHNWSNVADEWIKFMQLDERFDKIAI